MPKVSIIIPAYNAAEYLPTSLTSCVNQSFKDFEIIIVNDGSVDNTNAVVNEFKKGFSHIDIHLLEKPNGGLVSARKYGVQYAVGDFLFFLDADDKIFPDTLQLLYEHSDGYDIIIGDFVLENQRGELLPIQHKNRNFF